MLQHISMCIAKLNEALIAGIVIKKRYNSGRRGHETGNYSDTQIFMIRLLKNFGYLVVFKWLVLN